MTEQKNQILVTGGTGYIGSHTVVELQQNGYEVLIVDNLVNSRIETLDQIEKITGIKPNFVELDLCDKEATINFFNDNKNISAIIHFAALKSVEESLKEPILYYNNNLGSLINLADNAIKNQITNFVFSSSCTVYGQPDNIPVNESTPFKPSESVYGETKQISEGILERLSNNSDMSVISLRYFNPIGAHESALIGELATSTATNLVPLVTETAIKKREKLFVFGNDYNTKDGTCVRDYIHVVDIAKAHVSALQRLFQGNKTNYEVFNLGTGNGTTVLEIIHAFEKVSGIKLNYEITDRRSGDVEQIYSDSKLANEVLGWKAEKSLEEMLSSAWNWEQQLTEQNSIVEQE